MADNKKDNQKSGSQSSMTGSGSDREYERQGQIPGSENGGQRQQAGASSRLGSASPGNKDDEDMDTAGGREGNFSDSNRDSEDQWSPGSNQSSDQ